MRNDVKCNGDVFRVGYPVGGIHNFLDESLSCLVEPLVGFGFGFVTFCAHPGMKRKDNALNIPMSWAAALMGDFCILYIYFIYIYIDGVLVV